MVKKLEYLSIQEILVRAKKSTGIENPRAIAEYATLAQKIIANVKTPSDKLQCIRHIKDDYNWPLTEAYLISVVKAINALEKVNVEFKKMTD